MRRRAYDSFLVTSGAKEHDLLSRDERSFLQAAEIGDLPTVKAMLESDEERAPKLFRCTDYKDRTALEVSTENEHLEIVEYLVKKGGRKLDIQAIHESLMLAISKGYLRITQALLDHPVHQQSKDKFRLGSLTTYYQRKNNSKFEQDVTPLMLAAHCNEIDIIRLLLNRGDTIKKPHNSLCQCTYCSNKKQFDPLKHSLAGFNTYRALASPAYTALTSPDPILSAFLLSQELSSNAKIEKEFKNEYRDLARQCKEFASDLLDMCQNSEEVRSILNNEATSLEESEYERVTHWWKKEDPVDEERLPSLSRLKLAIKLRQKQFVAHPHCQHELATLWYRNFPSWRLMSQLRKVLVSMLIVLGLPVFTLCYYLAPHTKVGEFVSSPLVKFILYSASYFLFLLIIFIESLYAQSYSSIPHTQVEEKLTNTLRSRLVDDGGGGDSCLGIFPKLLEDDFIFSLRFFTLTPLEILIIIFLFGFLWGEIKQLWGEGLQAYLSSVWNWIDIAMLNLYFASCTLNIYSVVRAKMAINFFMTTENAACLVSEKHAEATTHYYFLQRERSNWHNDDPVFVSEALYALANMLSFSRLSYILPVSEFLGPLQISLGRMLGDILRFAVVFIVVFLAFFCSMFNLYYSFEDSKFGTFGSAFLTLFWALFGLGNLADPQLQGVVTNSTGSTGTVASDRGGYLITETFGTMLYMIYYVVMGLVMLNMLIAMMSNSFQEINSEQDVEWKFARAQLWMSYFEKGATIPVPFNLIPSPKSFVRFYQWVVRKFKRLRRTPRPDRGSNQVPMGERRNGVFNILNRKELKRQESTHESITKGITKRFLFKLQRDKDNDEVNEGELDEIKNDISSLRFELMEQLRGGLKTPYAQTVPSSAPAFTFQFPSASSARQAYQNPDVSAELNALKTKLGELSKQIATLTSQAPPPQPARRPDSASESDRVRARRDCARTSECNILRENDRHSNRRWSSPWVLDLEETTERSVANVDRDFLQTSRRNDRGGGGSADGGDRRGDDLDAASRRESLQRAYNVSDIVAYAGNGKQRISDNESARADDRYGPSEQRRQTASEAASKPNQAKHIIGGISGTSSTDPEPQHGMSRTLSRGSIHVGFDLETCHDPVLHVVSEGNREREYHHTTPGGPRGAGGARAREPESPRSGVYHFDHHRDEVYLRRAHGEGGGTRRRRDQDAGFPKGLYNIAFSLDA